MTIPTPGEAAPVSANSLSGSMEARMESRIVAANCGLALGSRGAGPSSDSLQLGAAAESGSGPAILIARGIGMAVRAD